MEQIREDLIQLCLATGVAGQQDIARLCQEMLAPLTDRVEIDPMGNVLAWRFSGDPDAPTLLLEAHMDEIGFLVTHVDDGGFVHVTAAGGVDERVLTGQAVIVYGDKLYAGVFGSTPPHLAKKNSELPELSECGIDVGLTCDAAKSAIAPGSPVSFAPVVRQIGAHRISSKAVDDRAGIAAILHCLRQIDRAPSINIAVAFCVQEELGCRGSAPAVRRVAPDQAIAIDVSFALTPDIPPHECGKLAEGAMIGISPILNSGMTHCLQQLAKENDIPQQPEVMAGRTGTDADNISTALLGIPTALLSIPLRYMHTPIETVDLRDIAAVGNLMAAYIRKGGVGNE